MKEEAFKVQELSMKIHKLPFPLLLTMAISS